MQSNVTFKDKKDGNLNRYFHKKKDSKKLLYKVQNFIQKYVMQNSLISHGKRERTGVNVTEDFSIVKKCASKFVHARKITSGGFYQTL